MAHCHRGLQYSPGPGEEHGAVYEHGATQEDVPAGDDLPTAKERKEKGRRETITRT